MNIINQHTFKHYSMMIEVNTSSGSFSIRFQHLLSIHLFLYITELNVLIIVYHLLFRYIHSTNTFYTLQESIIIENGYYRLTEIIVIINQMEFTQFDLSSRSIDYLNVVLLFILYVFLISFKYVILQE